MPKMIVPTSVPAGGDMRPLGESQVRARYRQKALALVKEERLLRVAMSFRIHRLDQPASEVMQVEGEALYAPLLLPDSGRLTALAFGVCTVGRDLERRITTLFAERKASLAVALDSLGNELLFDASRRLQDRIVAAARKQGLDVAGELRAGDPGLALEEQGKVLRLAGADKIGVAVTKGLLLDPVKSTSVVMGVGEDLPPVSWSRCDDCPSRPKCCAVKRQEGQTAG